MSRRVVITGLGPVTGVGLGIEPTWQALLEGRSAVRPIEAFDASGFACQVAAEVDGLKISRFVPKTYRKATKVMARDIEIAVAAADLAARDAALVTKGTVDPKAPDAEFSYQPSRVGVHIGAGLIAADLNELTDALVEARNGQGEFDMHKWGAEGINHLTPLWLLKYLPNMLACHVTIIHDAQGPSNTITCAEASSGLSVGESLRVIQRGAADLCFCGGAESKVNPMGFFRQHQTGWLTTTGNDEPERAVRPFDQTATGAVVGEGGGIVMLEALDTYGQRSGDKKVYCEVVGFGASQSVNLDARNRAPEPTGRGIATAIEAALREAMVEAGQIDLVVAFGSGHPRWDVAEVAALSRVFGARLKDVPVVTTKQAVGTCNAGAGAIDIAIAAKAVYAQAAPPPANRDNPIDGLGDAILSGPVRHALVYSTGIGGQNTSLVFKQIDG